MYEFSDLVHESGLMSYGPNFVDLWPRAAYFVDRILRGAKPADLPLEHPTKLELFVNLKTARARPRRVRGRSAPRRPRDRMTSLNLKTAKTLGLAIPSSLLTRADHVIQ
jgi:hypothetical protein